MTLDLPVTPLRAERLATHRQGGALHWLRELTRSQWFVLIIVSAAWYFDTLDQRLFSLARLDALADLMGLTFGDPLVQSTAKRATAVMLVGWGCGGLAAGLFGDRYGHARVLTLSIVIYAAGSALTAVCHNTLQFMVLRAATGVGIGGIFGLAVTIIADTVRGPARLASLTALQIVAALANMTSPVIKMGVDRLVDGAVIARPDGWRVLFAISALPIVLALVCAVGLRETAAWRERRGVVLRTPGSPGIISAMLADRRARRNLLTGTVMAVAAVVGLWGIGEFATDLQTTIFTAHYAALVPSSEVAAKVALARNWAFFLQMLGATVGTVMFGVVAHRIGRRPAFLGWFTAAFLITVLAYWKMATPIDAYWMMPLMGAAQLGLFGGLAIYLPELFGPAVRGTGVSFTYNIGRFAAALVALGSAWLARDVFGSFASPLPLRYSSMLMCSSFLIGALASWLAPETRGAEDLD